MSTNVGLLQMLGFSEANGSYAWHATKVGLLRSLYTLIWINHVTQPFNSRICGQSAVKITLPEPGII